MNTISGYTMSRNHVSVVKVWNEYDAGVGGRDSIKSLNEQFKAKWRNSETDRKFYASQAVFYRCIEGLATRLNISCSAAAQRLENLRNRKELSLAELRDNLKWEGLQYYTNNSTNLL